MASAGADLARYRNEKLRSEAKAALAALRARIQTARVRRAGALLLARNSCRLARRAVRARILEYRKAERARVNSEAKAMRLAARARCQARKNRIAKAGGGLLELARRKLAEERRYQRQLKGMAALAQRKHAKLASTKERRQEDNDYVRGNLPAELVPVFDRVARNIRGGPRTTRTEAFLQWAEEHPGEVLEYQQHEADREVARLVAEHERMASRLRKTRPRSQGRAANAVPF